MRRTNVVQQAAHGGAGPGAPRRSPGPLLVFVALVVIAAVPAAGQTAATNFAQLRSIVEAGDTVYVTEASGEPERRARILELSTSTLSVLVEGVRRDLFESDVRRIRQRLPDSKKNGALIGFLAGAAVATGAAKALESPAGSCGAGCVSANVLYGGGAGALGLGLDALIQGRKVIYVAGERRSSPRVALRPFALPAAMASACPFGFDRGTGGGTCGHPS